VGVVSKLDLPFSGGCLGGRSVGGWASVCLAVGGGCADGVLYLALL